MPKKSNYDLCVDELITTEAKYVETLNMLIRVRYYVPVLLVMRNINISLIIVDGCYIFK